MFYSQYVLAKKGPLGKIWLAAHMEKRVPKVQIIATNIPESVDSIENPAVPMALRVSGHLLLGVVRIFSRKVHYLMSDCSEAMVKIKDAFRQPGAVEMAPKASTRRYDDITNPHAFNEMDLDAALPSEAFAFGTDAYTAAADQQALYDMDALPGAALDDGVAASSLQLEGGTVGGAATPQMDEPSRGFGQNEDYAVWFEEAPPSSKRRRASVESEMDVEQMRAGTPQRLSDPYGLEAPPPPPADDDYVTRFDEGRDSLAEPPLPGAMDDILFADEPAAAHRRSSRVSEPTSSQEEMPPPKSRPTRRMVEDKRIQIPTDRMKALLADTSSIVLDVDAGAIEAPAAEAAPEVNPFLALPHLPFFPTQLAAHPRLAPTMSQPDAKRARVGERGPAEAAAAELEPEEQWRAASLGGADEQYAMVEMEPQYMPEDAPWRADEMEAPMAPRHGFATDHELPGVEDEGAAVATPLKGEPRLTEGETPRDEATWGKRTHKMYAMLQQAFEQSSGEPLSYDAMVATTRAFHKRRIVAGCFGELLFLATHGVTDLSQHAPYGDIIIEKAPIFDSIPQVAAN